MTTSRTAKYGWLRTIRMTGGAASPRATSRTTSRRAFHGTRGRRGLPASDEPHLGLQPYPTPLPHRPLGDRHQDLHVRRPCPAVVHDEVCMTLREARPTNPP